MIRPALIALTLAFAVPAFAQDEPLKPIFDAQMGADGVTVMENGKPAFSYRTKAATGAEAGRLAYLHPLYAPDGTVLTEDGAASYPQQRGAYWAWPRVMLNGQDVADSWNLKGMTYTIRETKFGPGPDGTAELTLKSEWLINSQPELIFAADEVTRVRIYPLKKGSRRIEIDTSITPRVDGLSLAGNDDERGFGGFALRLTDGADLAFASDGQPMKATFGAQDAGTSVGFAWPGQPGLKGWAVGLACQAQGTGLRTWMLRREASVQNCVFPGRAPVTLTKGQPLRLQATLVVSPR